MIVAFPISKNLFLYIDKSKINKKVSALAKAKSVVCNSFLGYIDLFTVYLKELYGILLGIGLASYMKYRLGKIFIYVDN